MPPQKVKTGELLTTLKTRFDTNPNRHKGVEWARVQARLQANPEKLRSLHDMEKSGGEPDVIGDDEKTGVYVFFDCSAESRHGRRSICDDRDALEARKEHKTKTRTIE